jgi:Kazal-type serine protease inhibitor domain
MRYKWLMLAAVGVAVLGVAASGADAKVGQRCGGKIQITCGPGEWCQPPTGQCRPGAPGRCIKVPEVCPMQQPEVVFPVCGCNGTTYPNDCERQRAKEAKKHNRKC